jgi:murein L,D-transpeptidase YcbB/YkuD
MRTQHIRRTIAALGAAATVTLGLSAAAPAGAAAQCPAQEIRKVWDGGTSTVKACENMADRLDHLFYPGSMLTTALNSVYKENVVFVQLRLRDLNYSPLAIDGYYGTQTAGAVKRYQKNHGLVVDGKVGKQTWKALFGLGPA